MRVPSSLKQEFARKWLPDLKSRGLDGSQMSVTEKTVAIKLSADAAMASARNRGGTNPCWTHAILSRAWPQHNSRATTSKAHAHAAAPCRKTVWRRRRRMTQKQQVMMMKKKKNVMKKVGGGNVAAKSIARKMVSRRTKLLRCLVPGGESMDDFSLIHEALDYMVSLRAQVDVMRRALAVSAAAFLRRSFLEDDDQVRDDDLLLPRLVLQWRLVIVCPSS